MDIHFDSHGKSTVWVTSSADVIPLVVGLGLRREVEVMLPFFSRIIRRIARRPSESIEDEALTNSKEGMVFFDLSDPREVHESTSS